MADPLTAAAIIALVAKKAIETLAGESTKDLFTKLKGDPAQKAFQQALAGAVQRYATKENRLELARPLLEKDSPLAADVVAAELAQVVRFDREANARLIGEWWKESVADPPTWRNFAEEAQLLLGFLKDELRATDVFRPVFEAKTLDAIAANAAISATALSDMEARLANLYELMTARFSELARVYTTAGPGIRGQIRDFSRLINEKTRGFVGRQFVFDALTDFMEENPQGYFVIRGDPGIGKTALSAQLLKTHGYVHHFNIRAEGINKADTFLKNICAQLIAKYNLTHESLPPEATHDAGFLTKLLGEVSDALANQKAVIVVDALDEVDMTNMSPGTNPLYLPITLPTGIYVVVTARKETLDQREAPTNLRIECEQQTLYIEQTSQGNIADIREYVQQAVGRPGIQDYINTQEIDNALFIDHLVEKSQGNFMYLHYVLPEIENGAYKDLELAALPSGLRNYYEDHWRRMKGTDRESWLTYKLPVVMALTVVKEPVSMDLLEDFSGIHERQRIYDVLEDWAQFLYVEQVPYENSVHRRYRVYHASFHDFIKDKDVVREEGVSLQEAHKKIADRLWTDLFGATKESL